MNSYREKYANLVNWFILTEVMRGAPEKVYEAASHLIKAGGKRVRPFIVMAMAKALGGWEAEKAALPIAAGIEIFHNFTLIHDDIMDKDEFRRGVPTTHVVYGIDFAILAGDLAFALSYKSMKLAKVYGLPPHILARSYETLTEAAVRVSEGQAYDMMFERMESVSYHDYLKMIYLKTGALIEASARLGALVASAYNDEVKANHIEAAGEYGRFVGISFQIRDDILGVFGDPKITGKPRYNDLRRGKKTLLVLYAYDHAESEEEKGLLREVLRGRVHDEEGLRRAAEIIAKTGALSYAEQMAKSLMRNAIQVLDDLPVIDSEAKTALAELARFVVEREK